ncbi:MAG TPA: porin family protein [Candidatus Polarisedimenticolaceae bacterium]
MNLKRLAPFPLVAVALVATPSLAAENAGYGELGFDVGFADLDSRVADESGGRLAFRGGYRFTPVFGFEGQLFALGADGIAGTYVTGADDVTIGVGMMNFSFSLPTKSNVVPYVLVGAGRANTEFDPGLFENGVDDSGLAWQAALGARLYFSPARRMALRVEASRLEEETFDAWKAHYSLTAGLTWRLGD